MDTRNSARIKNITYSGLFLAIAMVLPFMTGQIPEIGSMLCPMHIPVLLCGFVCGWPWGLAVGFVAPVMRSLLFGMPKVFPSALAMTFELAAYGALTGLLYKLLPKKRVNVYVALISSMIIGRLVWGVAQFLLQKAVGIDFTLAMFMAGAVTTALPGIILHIIIIPVLVEIFSRAGLITNK